MRWVTLGLFAILAACLIAGGTIGIDPAIAAAVPLWLKLIIMIIASVSTACGVAYGSLGAFLAEYLTLRAAVYRWLKRFRSIAIASALIAVCAVGAGAFTALGYFLFTEAVFSTQRDETAQPSDNPPDPVDHFIVYPTEPQLLPIVSRYVSQIAAEHPQTSFDAIEKVLVQRKPKSAVRQRRVAPAEAELRRQPSIRFSLRPNE